MAKPTTSAPRVLRAWVVMLALALLAVVSFVASPPLRDQLRQSTQRVDLPYLAVSFTDPQAARACRAHSGAMAVSVSVASRLKSRSDVRMRISTQSTTRGKTHQARQVGTVATRPKRTSVARLRISVPRTGPYIVRIDLPGYPNRLRLNCDRST